MATDIKLADLVLDTGIASEAKLRDFGNGFGPKYQTELKRVAVVGFAPSSLSQAISAVFNNAEWVPEKGCEVWGLNELYLVGRKDAAVADGPIDKKWDRWFDIHDPRSTISTRDDKNMDWLAAQTKPIYMIQHFADIPASVSYPLHEIVSYWESDYLTNTISMMILLACMEGRYQKDVWEQVDGKNTLVHRKGEVEDPSKAFGEIQIWGVDMAQDSEYNHQRPSCEAAVGFARGLGIKVFIPDTSDLLKCLFVYGYMQDGMHVRAKLDARIGELKAQADNHRNIGQQAKLSCAAMIGASNEMSAIVNAAERQGIQHPILEQLKARVQEMQPEIAKANAASEANLTRAAMLDGAHDDAVFWRRAWSGA